MLVKGDHAITLGIGDRIAKYCRSVQALSRGVQDLGQAMTKEDVVAQNDDDEDRLEKVIDVAASPRQVFTLLTDADGLSRWLTPVAYLRLAGVSKPRAAEELRLTAELAAANPGRA